MDDAQAPSPLFRDDVILPGEALAAQGLRLRGSVRFQHADGPEVRNSETRRSG
jgi:hypothetical protein